MKAIVLDRFGDESVLHLGDVPSPPLSRGDLRIRVHAAGVNRADLLQREGHYPPPPGASEILGMECAGEVLEVGSDVASWRGGDRVMGLLPGWADGEEGGGGGWWGMVRGGGACGGGGGGAAEGSSLARWAAQKPPRSTSPGSSAGASRSSARRFAVDRCQKRRLSSAASSSASATISPRARSARSSTVHFRWNGSPRLIVPWRRITSGRSC